MVRNRVSSLISFLTMLVVPFLLLLSMLPLVNGDGMPVYKYVPKGVDSGELYGTTFESRQLARVELLNTTHQRIDLFLSIFTLRPGGNLTVLVPFREIPVEVDVKESTDAEFLDDMGYDDIVEAHREQNWGESGKRFRKRTSAVATNAAISTAFTPLGLGARYYMENLRISRGNEGGFAKSDSAGSLGGGDEYEPEVKEVAHYDFEGVSISVYSVSANATLDDFLEVVDLGTIPDITRNVVEEYREQYVAVIESVPSPPIDAEDYSWLMEFAPNTVARIIDKVRADPKVGFDDISKMAPDFAHKAFVEYIDGGGNTSIPFEGRKGYGHYHNYSEEYMDWYQDYYRWEYEYVTTPFGLRDMMKDLFYAIYGFTDFKGNVLRVTTALNDGEMYFPLGTSKGWDNPIQDTRVIYTTDEDISLDVTPEPVYSAFVDGKHHYVLEYMSDNPEKDTTARIGRTSKTDKFSASASTLLYDSTPWLSVLLGVGLQFLLFFIFLQISSKWQSRKKKGKDRKGTGTDLSPQMKVFTWRHLIMSVLNIFISAPITLLLMGDIFGPERKRRQRNFYLQAYVPLILMDVILFSVEVVG